MTLPLTLRSVPHQLYVKIIYVKIIKHSDNFKCHLMWLADLTGLQKPHTCKHSQTKRVKNTNKCLKAFHCQQCACGQDHREATVQRQSNQRSALCHHLENVDGGYKMTQIHGWEFPCKKKCTVHYQTDQDLCSLLSAGA